MFWHDLNAPNFVVTLHVFDLYINFDVNRVDAFTSRMIQINLFLMPSAAEEIIITIRNDQFDRISTWDIITSMERHQSSSTAINITIPRTLNFKRHTQCSSIIR